MHGEASSYPNEVQKVVISSLMKMASVSLAHKKQLTHIPAAMGISPFYFMERIKVSG
jgi:hypothetical protein